MSAFPPLPVVISQKTYPGVGDLDECWVLATYAAVRYSLGDIELPTIYAFRKAAGNPDLPGPTGGKIDHICNGVDHFWPGLNYIRLAGVRWDTAVELMRRGHVLSLAIVSEHLPLALQYGFAGLHQIAAGLRGATFYLGNPLAPDGSHMRPVAEADIRSAALAFGGGYVFAVGFPPRKENDPVSVFLRTDKAGTITIPASTEVRGYDWSPDGSGLVAAKKRPAGVEVKARFDYTLRRASGDAIPSSLVHVTDGYLAGLFVSTVAVTEEYDPDARDAEIARLKKQIAAAKAALG